MGVDGVRGPQMPEHAGGRGGFCLAGGGRSPPREHDTAETPSVSVPHADVEEIGRHTGTDVPRAGTICRSIVTRSAPARNVGAASWDARAIGARQVQPSTAIKVRPSSVTHAVNHSQACLVYSKRHYI